MEKRDGQYHILLDGRPVKTPARKALVVPWASMADGICREWQEQGDRIKPRLMPLTGLAKTVIDAVVPHRQTVIDNIAAYGGDDLICYRAGEPEELLSLQDAAWNPLLAWARDELGVELLRIDGVMPLNQSPEDHRRLRLEVAKRNDFELAGLHNLVTLSGSLIIGLSVAVGHKSAEEGWQLSRIDEDYQIANWGEDEEAAAQAKRHHDLFVAAERFISLSK